MNHFRLNFVSCGIEKIITIYKQVCLLPHEIYFYYCIELFKSRRKSIFIQKRVTNINIVLKKKKKRECDY